MLTVVPERSAWMLGGGYDVPVNFEELSKQVEGAYQDTLDDAIDTVPIDLPVRRYSDTDPRVQRSSMKPAPAITT